MGCYVCEKNALLDTLPPRQRIVVHGGWRVAHSFNTSLPGWLVLDLLRHETTFAATTDDEAAAFGMLVRAGSAALHDVTACTKTYVMLFAEKAGWEHLHAHLVPRMPTFEPHEIGPGVFALSNKTQADSLPESTRDEVALALRARMEAALGASG